MGPDFGLVIHLLGEISYAEEWHLDCVPVQFLIIPHAVTDKQAFCGFFFLSHAGPAHIYKA